MVKNWCIYIFLLVATVIFFLFYKMWVAWYCLMILLVFPLVALIMCIFSAVTFKYKVEAPGYVKLKEDASIIFRVNNLSSGFSFCKFNVTITDVMDGSSHNLGYTRHDKSQYDLPVDTTHCGSYIYNISKVKIYDMFGLFHINRVREKKFEVVVRPTPSMPKAMPNLNGFRAKSLRKSTSPHSRRFTGRRLPRKTDSSLRNHRKSATAIPVYSCNFRKTASFWIRSWVRCCSHPRSS